MEIKGLLSYILNKVKKKHLLVKCLSDLYRDYVHSALCPLMITNCIQKRAVVSPG